MVDLRSKPSKAARVPRLKRATSVVSPDPRDKNTVGAYPELSVITHGESKDSTELTNLSEKVWHDLLAKLAEQSH